MRKKVMVVDVRKRKLKHNRMVTYNCFLKREMKVRLKLKLHQYPVT